MQKKMLTLGRGNMSLTEGAGAKEAGVKKEENV